MKRIATIALMVLLTLTASARSIRYFTHDQALRTVTYLDRQNELMIYCGYDYEIETYVLVNEVWMERVNSSFYEIWLYGYDAYTGDEVYMPLDLQCIWLLGAGGRMYNAAQYLRFHATVHVPTFAWYIPPYNPYTRHMHAVGYARTYHYDVHCHGWRPPTPPANGWGPHTQPPIPPYYMRTPQQPAPAPTAKWTPGVEHPQVSQVNASSTPRSSTSVRGNTTSGGGTSATESRSSGTARSGSTTSTSRSQSGTTGSSNPRSSTDGTTTGSSTRSSSSTSTSRSTGSTRSTATTPTRTNTGAGSTSNNTDTRTSSATTNASRSQSSTANTRTSDATTTNSSRSGSNTSNSRSTTSGSSSSRSSASRTSSSRSTTGTSNSRSTTNTSNSRSNTSTRTR